MGETSGRLFHIPNERVRVVRITKLKKYSLTPVAHKPQFCYKKSITPWSCTTLQYKAEEHPDLLFQLVTEPRLKEGSSTEVTLIYTVWYRGIPVLADTVVEDLALVPHAEMSSYIGFLVLRNKGIKTEK